MTVKRFWEIQRLVSAESDKRLRACMRVWQIEDYKEILAVVGVEGQEAIDWRRTKAVKQDYYWKERECKIEITLENVFEEIK